MQPRVGVAFVLGHEDVLKGEGEGMLFHRETASVQRQAAALEVAQRCGHERDGAVPVADKVLCGHAASLETVGLGVEHVGPVGKVGFKHAGYAAHVQVVVQRI